MATSSEGVPVHPGRRIALPIGGAVAVFAALAFAALPAASSPAVQQPTVAVSPSTIAAGGTITVSGTVPPDPGGDPCSDPGAQITLTSAADLFPPDGFGPQVPLGSDGTFQTTYAVPAATPPGAYSIGLRCGGANLGGRADLQVVAPATTQPSQPAPTSTAATTSTSTTTTTSSESSTTTRRTTTSAAPTGTTGDDNGTPWIPLAVVAVLLAGGGAGAVALRRRRSQRGDDEQPPEI